jgi:hypothetical protein
MAVPYVPMISWLNRATFERGNQHPATSLNSGGQKFRMEPQTGHAKYDLFQCQTPDVACEAEGSCRQKQKKEQDEIKTAD